MSEINYVEVGKRIVNLREQLNLNRTQLSKAVEVSIGYFCQIEKGQRNASLPVTIKLAEALGVSLDYLIYGDKSIDVDKNELHNIIDNASNRQLKVISDILTSVIPNLKK